MKAAKPYLIRCTGCRAKNRIPADKINHKPVCGKCRQSLDLSAVFADRPVEVSDGSFEKQVIESPIPVMAFFYSPSCPVCQSEMPVTNRVASGLTGRIRVAKINIDQNPRTASRFNVKSVPTMIVFDNGREKEKITGAVPEIDILKKLAPYY